MIPALNHTGAGGAAPSELNGAKGPYFTVLVRFQPEDRLRPNLGRAGVVCLPLDYDSENLQHIAHLKGLPR